LRPAPPRLMGTRQKKKGSLQKGGKGAGMAFRPMWVVGKIPRVAWLWEGRRGVRKIVKAGG